MRSLTTETFPYTLEAVSKLLKTEEEALLGQCAALGIQPHYDTQSGIGFLSVTDVEKLRQKTLFPESSVVAQAPHTMSAVPSEQALPQKNGYSTLPQRARMSRTDLSMIIDSVSSVKEEILSDLSQLLEERLSGLDEIVVELIRSKSELDTLRDEVRQVEESRNALQQELSKYRPAAFGFYRKVT